MNTITAAPKPVELPSLPGAREYAPSTARLLEGIRAAARNDAGFALLDGAGITTAPLTEKHQPAFEKKYSELQAGGIFRARMPEEMEQVRATQKIFLHGNTLIGGYSLLPDGPSDLEFAVVWTHFPGSGIGRHMARHAQTSAMEEGKSLYTLTGTEKVALGCFVPAGFKYQGRVSDVQAASNTRALPPHVAGYDTSARNPHYLTFN